MVYEELRTILIQDLQLTAEALSPTASRAEVGLDSLAVVELAALLAKRFGVVMHDYELLEAETVADIATLLNARCKSAAAVS
jgi:acyl carrier protein